MAVLLAVVGPRAGARYELDSDAEVGRSAGCRIRIVDDRVSRRHAYFTVQDGRYLVVDLGSRNGTYINDERIKGEVPLSAGDRIRFGKTQFVFEPTLEVLAARYTGGLVVVDDTTVAAPPGETEIRGTGVRGSDLMRRLADRLSGHADEPGVLVAASEELGAGFAAERSVIITSDRGSESISPAAVTGGEVVVLPRSVLQQALDRGEPVRVVHDPSAIDLDGTGPAVDGGGRTLLAAPMATATGRLGMVLVQRKQEEGGGSAYDAGDLERLHAAAAVVGMALQTARDRERLEREMEAHRRGGVVGEAVLVGDSPPLRTLLTALVERVSGQEPVCLVGESGTGRELAARYLHERSGPAARPFVTVVAAALPGGEAGEAVLFGREAGGAGGGGRLERGAVERADGGTLYIAGFSDLPDGLRLRVLRAVQDRALTREGGQRPVPARFRLVYSEVARTRRGGRAVTDLLRRLGAVVVEVPPLRERLDDLPLLFDHFAEEVAASRGLEPLALGADARDAAMRYDWPGNVRELRALVERVVHARGSGELTVKDLPRGAAGPGMELPAGATLADRVAALEATAIRQAMEAEDGRKVRVAQRLGISRPTLDRKLELYGIRRRRRRR